MLPESRNALIVYAHPEPKSFNGAMKDAAVAALSETGWTVEVSDLHGENFDPVPRPGDFKALSNPDFFKYQAEQLHCVKTGAGFSADIERELARLKRADLLILQFPLWWFSVPAILKGWIDRVFVMGLIYGGDVGFYSRGAFRGRKAMLSFSTGGPKEMYSATGLNGQADVVLWPLQNGVLNFCGYDVLPYFHAEAPARASEEQRRAMLDAWKDRLRTIDQAPKLDFHPLEDFDPNAGWVLKPGIQGRTVGQPGRGAKAPE